MITFCFCLLPEGVVEKIQEGLDRGSSYDFEKGRQTDKVIIRKGEKVGKRMLASYIRS